MLYLLYGVVVLVPALIGIILGIADIISKRKKKGNKGMAIAGLVLSIISIAVMVLWFVLFGSAVSNKNNSVLERSEQMVEELEELQEREKEALQDIESQLYN